MKKWAYEKYFLGQIYGFLFMKLVFSLPGCFTSSILRLMQLAHEI